MRLYAKIILIAAAVQLLSASCDRRGQDATSPSTSAAPPASGSPSASVSASPTPAPSVPPSEPASPSPTATAPDDNIVIRLVEIAPEETFDRPVGLEKRAETPDKLYVVEQPGTIRLLDLLQPDAEPATVLDLTDRVSDNGNEKGLLGLAFHPTRLGEAYVNYTTATHTVISRFTADPAEPERLDPASEAVILTFKQPYSNHNGGQLAFGPDGMLYIAAGDGGGAGDPKGNGQNKDTLLGKILRIDVVHAGGGRAYAIPEDNPFANGGGAPEIFAYGLRNPWRFSFDAATGKLWAADVGQDKLEEINVIEKGGNYGWNIREGTACYKPSKGCASDNLIPPVYEYGRELGVSVTGGYVYRGKLVPGMEGLYVYADYAFGTIWGLFQHADGAVDNRTLLQSGLQITSFGTDVNGELYIVSQDGGIYRIEKG